VSDQVVISERSMELIRPADLELIGERTLDKLESIYESAEVAALFRDKLRILVLSQGAANHFVDKVNGIKDFDVWGFFEKIDGKTFPYRTVWKTDIGISRFGKHPAAPEPFIGRKIDIIGRAIIRKNHDAVSEMVAWLQGNSKSASELQKKSVVGIWPKSLRAVVFWNHGRLAASIMKV
jgi:hypothetical protein